MILTDHPNLLGAYCTFLVDANLWIVMPYMAGGSCFHLLKSSFPKGFEEERFIAFVLRETLRGLEYLHAKGHIHRDVKVTKRKCFSQNFDTEFQNPVFLSESGLLVETYRARMLPCLFAT
jgi:serine/threonine protein kinase